VKLKEKYILYIITTLAETLKLLSCSDVFLIYLNTKYFPGMSCTFVKFLDIKNYAGYSIKVTCMFI